MNLEQTSHIQLLKRKRSKRDVVKKSIVDDSRLFTFLKLKKSRQHVQKIHPGWTTTYFVPIELKHTKGLI